MTTKVKSRILLALIIVLIAHPPAIANENSNFLDKIIENFTQKCEGKQGIEYLNCWAKYTPKKCKNLVYGKDRMAWKRCVYSCGNASFISKNIGECSD